MTSLVDWFNNAVPGVARMSRSTPYGAACNSGPSCDPRMNDVSITYRADRRPNHAPLHTRPRNHVIKFSDRRMRACIARGHRARQHVEFRTIRTQR